MLVGPCVMPAYWFSSRLAQVAITALTAFVSRKNTTAASRINHLIVEHRKISISRTDLLGDF